MKYLKTYEELISVTSDITSSGKTRSVDNIFDEPSDAKSPSARILLKRDLQQKEFQDLIDMGADVLPSYTIKKWLKNPDDKRLEKFLVTLNNLKFLQDKAKEGELRCEYCNRGPLYIYDITKKTPEKLSNPQYRFTEFDPKDGATADHKEPQSKGGDKFDYSNLVVSCVWCNKEKGDMTYDEWMSRISKRKKVTSII